jgi:hypothetical protein
MCLASVGKNVEALSFFAKGIEYEPNSPWLHSNMAAILLILGQGEQALNYARKGVELSSGGEVLISFFYLLFGVNFTFELSRILIFFSDLNIFSAFGLRF